MSSSPRNCAADTFLPAAVGIEGFVMTPENPMTVDEIWTVYARLWGRCEGCGSTREPSIFVHYIEPEEGRIGEAGHFHPRDHDQERPQIAIVRPGCGRSKSAPSKQRQDGTVVSRQELLVEVCNLAHEFGHSRSWRDGERTKDYDEAVLAFDQGLPLSEVQQKLMLEEEERAWNYARLELDLLGFGDWARFDAMRACGLDAYRQTFWPTAR